MPRAAVNNLNEESTEVASFIELSRRYASALEKIPEDSLVAASLGAMEGGTQLMFGYETGILKSRWEDVSKDSLNVDAFKSSVLWLPLLLTMFSAYMTLFYFSVGQLSLFWGTLAIIAVTALSSCALAAASLKGSFRKNLAAVTQPHQVSFGRHGISLRWMGRPFDFQSPVLHWKEFELAVMQTDEKGEESLCLKNRKGQTLRLQKRGFSEHQFEIIKGCILEHLGKEKHSADSVLLVQPPLKSHLDYVTHWFWQLKSLKHVQAKSLQHGGRLEIGASLKEGAYRVVEDLGHDGKSSVYAAECVQSSSTFEEIARFQRIGGKEKAENGQDETRAVETGCQSPRRVLIREFYIPADSKGAKLWRLLSRLDDSNRYRTGNNRAAAFWLDHFVENSCFYTIEEMVCDPTIGAMVEADGPMSEERAINVAVAISQILSPPEIWSNADGLFDQSAGTAMMTSRHPLLHGKLSSRSFSVSPDGVVRLIDFDLLSAVNMPGHDSYGQDVAFTAPEQLFNAPTMRDDVYALGAIVYYMLSGQRPTPFNCSRDLSADSCPKMSAELRRILLKAVDPQRNNRYVNTEEIWIDLKKLRGDVDVLDDAGL